MRYRNGTLLFSKRDLRILQSALELLQAVEDAVGTWAPGYGEDATVGLLALESIVQRATPKVVILREYGTSSRKP